MAFIKAHLVGLICALAVLLALVALFVWPVPGYSNDLRTEETKQLALVDSFNNAGKLKIEIPGLKPMIGPITQKVIEEKEKVQKDMQGAAAEISQLASAGNEVGRIIRQKDPTTIDPVTKKPVEKVIPLLDDVPVPNYLPGVINGADPTDFYEAYLRTFDRWICELSTGSKTKAEFDPVHSASAPDKPTEIDPVWAEKERKRISELPTFPGENGVAAAPVQAAPITAAFMRNFVNERAAGTRMYVNRASFQVAPPTLVSTQIFESLVDCWLQRDVVRTIDTINSEALAKVSDTDRNVGQSPVKRLTHISVGTGAGGDATLTTLFFPHAAQSALDYSKSMTGRTGTDTYDVTDMDVVMDIDPSALNKFIAALYKQNNGYTVISEKITTVDPFVAASYGYIYGNGQVVTVDLKIEAMLFRGWTQSIMPPGYPNGQGVRAGGGGGSSPGPGGPFPGFPH